jgi:hypothetical protein
VKTLSYNHVVFYVISGILLTVAVTSVAMAMIPQVIAASNTGQIIKVRGPQDKFLTDEPVVSSRSGLQSDGSHYHWTGAAKPVGSNMTGGSNITGTEKTILVSPAGHPGEDTERCIFRSSAHPAGSNMTAGPAANTTGGAPGSPPTANPAAQPKVR